MTKFVWVYGPTAVGKETLITELIAHENHALAEKLEFRAPIFTHQEALVLRHDERAGLEQKLITKRAPGTMLIKAQGYDIFHQLPLRLRELLPGDEHLVLFLDAAPATLRTRRLKRGHPSGTWSDENDRAENLRYAKLLEIAGMNVMWIDTEGLVPQIAPAPV